MRYPRSNITDSDVLLGRGNGVAKHTGNQRFRVIIETFRQTYLSSARKMKIKVALDVIEQIQILNPPGRFMERSGTGCNFVQVTNKRAIEKVCQALREKQSSSRHSRISCGGGSASSGRNKKKNPQVVQSKNKSTSVVKESNVIQSSVMDEYAKLPRLAPAILHKRQLQTNDLPTCKSAIENNNEQPSFQMAIDLPPKRSQQGNDDVSVLSASFESFFRDISNLQVYENPIVVKRAHINDTNMSYHSCKQSSKMNTIVLNCSNDHLVSSDKGGQVSTHAMLQSFRYFYINEISNEETQIKAELTNMNKDEMCWNNDPLYSYYSEAESSDKFSPGNWLQDFTW